ncbi:MAG: sigma-70 family RNA polymerase sigma factor [Magnetococcales bacterium]|nr:sigma-70 family RNA polymerase sigma factor [Magnetococcales bacterium]
MVVSEVYNNGASGEVQEPNEGDQLLVKRAKTGDKKAFEILVRRYQGKIASVISRSVSDPDKVRDLTQESLIKAYRALSNFRGDSAFYTWLYRIAVNTAKNHLMSSGRGINLNDMDLEEADRVAPQMRDNNTPERMALRQEMLGNLDEAISTLSPMMKKAILMRDVEGFSYEEIARDMGCPIGTVRSRIFRGRQEIVDQMQEYMDNIGSVD